MNEYLYKYNERYQQYLSALTIILLVQMILNIKALLIVFRSMVNHWSAMIQFHGNIKTVYSLRTSISLSTTTSRKRSFIEMRSDELTYFLNENTRLKSKWSLSWCRRNRIKILQILVFCDTSAGFSRDSGEWKSSFSYVERMS